VSTQDLAALMKQLDVASFPGAKDGDTVEVSDSPSEPVVFRRASGTPFMFMARAAYDALMDDLKE
jgi:hypothetical protein